MLSLGIQGIETSSFVACIWIQLWEVRGNWIIRHQRKMGQLQVTHSLVAWVDLGNVIHGEFRGQWVVLVSGKHDRLG